MSFSFFAIVLSLRTTAPEMQTSQQEEEELFNILLEEVINTDLYDKYGETL